MAHANSFSAKEVQNITSDIIKLKNESSHIVNKVNSVSGNMTELENVSKQFKME